MFSSYPVTIDATAALVAICTVLAFLFGYVGSVSARFKLARDDIKSATKECEAARIELEKSTRKVTSLERKVEALLATNSAADYISRNGQ